MAGLQGFMGRAGQQTGTSWAPGFVREDRAAAMKLKINYNERASASGKKSRNNSQDSSYFPQGQGYHRSSLPAPQRREHLDSSSVADDFDKTLSERDFIGQLNDVEPVQDSDVDSEGLAHPDYDAQESFEDQGVNTGHYQEDDRHKIDLTVHHTKPLRRSSGSPNIKRQQASNHAAQGGQAINGRFEPNHNIPIRNQPEHDHLHSPSPKPKKRSRSTEPTHQIYSVQQEYRAQQPDHRPKKDHRSQPNAALPMTPNGIKYNGEAGHGKHVSPERTPRAGPANSFHVPSEPDATEGAQAKEPRIPLDHSIEQMRNMTFAQLSAESWEVGVDESPDDRPLPDRLQEIMSDVVVGEPNHVTMQFFSKMPTAEWEESGEWFVEQFSEIMQAMISKRKQRRILTTKYENELMQRENAVRGKSDALAKEFADMRAGGEHLLKGKV